jgi:hypothetical protein
MPRAPPVKRIDNGQYPEAECSSLDCGEGGLRATLNPKTLNRSIVGPQISRHASIKRSCNLDRFGAMSTVRSQSPMWPAMLTMQPVQSMLAVLADARRRAQRLLRD